MKRVILSAVFSLLMLAGAGLTAHAASGCCDDTACCNGTACCRR